MGKPSRKVCKEGGGGKRGVCRTVHEEAGVAPELVMFSHPSSQTVPQSLLFVSFVIS